MGNIFSIQMAFDCSIGRFWSCFSVTSNYLCNLQENLNELKGKVSDLQALRMDVMHMVENEIRQARIVTPSVEAWLFTVDNIIDKCHLLIIDGEREIHRVCCSGNLKFRYQLGKRIARILKEAGVLLAEKDLFPSMVERPPPEPVMESTTEPMLAQVWNSLNKEQVGIVGICGKEGVGKTRLLKQIRDDLLAAGDFDVVIWVTVSDSRLARVQEEIGKSIGIISDEKWKSKSIDEKSLDIFTSLRKKKFLLLLDDIWEPVDLANFGVVLPNRENGCKVVFTTHSEGVCREMEAQTVINMGDVAWQEASLQEKKSAIIAQATGRNYDDGPTTAAKLKTVARHSFKKMLTKSSTKLSADKEIVEDAEQEAEPSSKSATLPETNNLEDPENNGGGIDLKHRYDGLPNDTVKSCFLYCTLFPPDFRILKDDLVHYWICEKFEDDDYNGVRTFNEGYYIIDILVRAQLLEDQGKYVRLQSAIRDLGLQMADKFLVLAGSQLTEPPEVGKWKGVTRISLMENSIHNLRKIPACAHLLTLFLSRNSCLVMITGDFFLFMKSLTVLDLSMSSIQELPPEISHLVSLQYLNVSRTSVIQLPVELNKLTSLKYVNLDHTIFLSLIPREVISKLSSLQILKMFRCGSVSEQAEDNLLMDGNLQIEELRRLEHLKVLSITIRHDNSFQLLFSTDQLRRCTQALYLEHLIDSGSLRIPWSEINHQIINHSDESKPSGNRLNWNMSRNILFSSLQEVRVEKCFDLQDMTWLVLAPNLRILTVAICGKMEDIIRNAELGQVPDVSKNFRVFAKLEILELKNLPQMKSIYWEALAFPALEKIEVYNCPMLKNLPLDCDSGKGGKLVIKAEEHWWNDVEWMDEAAKIAFLPCFTSF